MSQQEVTDRIVDIIRKIKLDAMTGVLTVRRGEGVFSEQGGSNRQFVPSGGSNARTSSIEEGSITFLNGKMVEARVGRRSGSDAFNYLSTWGKCTYSFTFTQGNTATKAFLTPLPATPIPPSSALPTTPFPPSVPRRGSPDMPTGADATRRNPSATAPVPPAMRIPIRIKQSQHGMSILDKMGLSRAHRQLFLLIDDQRTIKDLARLMNCSEKEIEDRLEELEKIAVVKWSHQKPPNVRPSPKSEK